MAFSSLTGTICTGEMVAMRSTLHDNLRIERELAGLNHRQLGALLRLDHSTIVKWEMAQRKIPATILPHIAQALGITVARLHGESPAQILKAA